MKTVLSHVQSVVDSQTGEVMQTISNQTFSHGVEPNFIKLYINDILYLADMPTRHSQLLGELLKRSNYTDPNRGMTVTVNAAIKREIAATLNISNVGTISNALTDLVKGKILKRIDTGLYSFNPYLFGKGDWQSISKMRLTVDYDEIKGKTFNTVCAYERQKNKENEE